MDNEQFALANERDFLLRSLRDLDDERDAGNIDEEQYATLHGDYTARCAAVLRSISESESGSRRITRSQGDSTQDASSRRLRLVVWIGVVAFALFGLLGAINIPIINRSVVWWNSLHQPPSITAGKSAIEATFLVPLLVAVLGFSLLFGAIVLMRMRAALAEIRIEARMRRMAEG